MRKIGYARVSSISQNWERQIAALRAERCDEIFREKASAASIKGRPQLERAIDAVGKGDVLVVAEWDRATRSMMDGIAIIDRVLARGALVKVLDKPHLDLTTTIGKGLLALFSALAQDERERIHKRAQDGRQVAKAAGRRFGRKPKLTQHQQAEALERITAGEKFRKIGKSYNVSHMTISRLAGSRASG
jgi:DNA invertase Pin-like site-specific DNA recombinase